MNNIKKWKVCVRCFTYNHSPYIVDTLNGFCMQKTSFPFVCVVVDDASTDGEQDVIRKYLLHHFDLEDNSIVRIEETNDYYLTFAQHKSNKNCFFVVLLLKYNHYRNKDKFQYFLEWFNNSDYIALCEGDDYWTNTRKLQKQVDYLDQHGNCGLTAGFSNHYIQEKNTLIEISQHPYTEFRQILLHGGIGCATCTILYRLSLYNNHRQFISGNKWQMGDFPLYLYIAKNSNIYVFHELFATYRVLKESASHSSSYEKSDRFIKSIGDIQLFFANIYDKDLIGEIKNNLSIRLFHNAINYSKHSEVLKYFKSINNPSIIEYLRLIKYYIKKYAQS